jgi:hypothetical protein
MSTRTRIAVTVVGLVLAAVVSAPALAGSRPPGMPPQAYKALMLRSEALNVLYGLGKPAGMSVAAYRAMLAEGAALNERYGLATPFRADEIASLYGSRSDEVLPVARASAPAVATASTSGFDWADATIGAAFVAGLLAIGAAAALAVHRHRHVGHPRPH